MSLRARRPHVPRAVGSRSSHRRESPATGWLPLVGRSATQCSCGPRAPSSTVRRIHPGQSDSEWRPSIRVGSDVPPGSGECDVSHRPSEQAASCGSGADPRPRPPIARLSGEPRRRRQVSHRRWFADWMQERYGIVVAELPARMPSWQVRPRHNLGGDPPAGDG